MTTSLRLSEVSHPSKDAAARYDALMGIDGYKEQLLDELSLWLDAARVEKWQKTHHPKGLPGVGTFGWGSPLILLSGDVGCGKTALATSVGTPLARELDRKVIAMETPSDIRGHGLVGELSTRITDAFSQARARAKHVGCGLLVIDEADDLATARDQMHAHHEDRAGVNALIKEVDAIGRERTPLAVLLITNRSSALDPAVMRRASLHLRFGRPNATQRRALLERLLMGTRATEDELETLVEATSARRGVPFSFSDLTMRLGRSALRQAWRCDCPFGAAVLLEALVHIEPSPLVTREERTDA
ncbi:ATP-binding protein [Polyangium jinanense]|uniref:AAA family ATPase n=1 Tax=Polyangium jinanense TaxID=2829994 RepID=A0A9X4ATR1_9BACT|nr:ATP-binding protein [Polyangium jinanense]MDC3956339.1 AAA family ATPase [Polyangium jinanense]MDC3982475.1 AAA family ATPase [Polyangium jinanense]